jgi:hypothetical protein
MPMGQAGKFLRRVGAADGHTAGGYAHWCPACEEMHAFAVDKPFSNGAKWTFDGNLDAPTFSPSMLIRTGPRPMVPLGRPDAGKVDVCHYFLTAAAAISRRQHTCDERPDGAAPRAAGASPRQDLKIHRSPPGSPRLTGGASDRSGLPVAIKPVIRTREGSGWRAFFCFGTSGRELLADPFSELCLGKL